MDIDTMNTPNSSLQGVDLYPSPAATAAAAALPDSVGQPRRQSQAKVRRDQRARASTNCKTCLFCRSKKVDIGAYDPSVQAILTDILRLD